MSEQPLSEIPPPELQMKPTQAAKLVGVHLATIYRWMDDGLLPFWRKGRRQRFLYKPDVLALVRAERVRQKSAPTEPPRMSAWEQDYLAAQTRKSLEARGYVLPDAPKAR